MRRYLVLSVLGTSVALAQGVPPELQQCVAEADDARRLACFDAGMARLASARPAPAPAAGAAAVAPAPASAPAPAPVAASTPEQVFGARGELAREVRPPEERSLRQLDAHVAALARRTRGELVVTLDNGQVWQLLSPLDDPRLAVGEAVTIKPGSMGSYFLSGPAGRAAKAKRIK